MHALHTVHALPDLRVAGGRLGDVFYHASLFGIEELRLTFLCPKQAEIPCREDIYLSLQTSPVKRLRRKPYNIDSLSPRCPNPLFLDYSEPLVARSSAIWAHSLHNSRSVGILIVSWSHEVFRPHRAESVSASISR